MKQWACVLMILVMTAVGASAADTHELSVAAAVELGFAQNLDMALTDFRVEEARAELQRQRIVGDEEAMAEAEERLADALSQWEQAKEDLATAIENSYYDILTAKARLAELEQNLEDSASSYQMERARYQAGMISQLTLERSSNALLNAQLNVARQQDTVETTMYRLKDLLGMPMADNLVLTDSVDLTYQPLDMSFDEALTTGLKHADAMLAAQESLDEAAESVRLADNSYTPRATLEKAQMDQRRAEVNYEKAKNRVFFDIRTAYLRVKQLEASLELLEREVDYAQRQVAVAHAQHADGVISDAALVDAERSAENAEAELSDALWDHVRARRDLFLAMGQPIVEWEE